MTTTTQKPQSKPANDAACSMVWFEATSWGRIQPITIVKACALRVQLPNGRWRAVDSGGYRIRPTFEEAKKAMIGLLLIERDQIIDRLRHQDEKIERYRKLNP